MSSIEEESDPKRRRMVEAKTVVELSKGLMHSGASLHKKKAVIMANLSNEDGKILAVHHIKYGGVGTKLYLLPKELEDNVSPDYSETGELVAITKGELKVEGTAMKAVVMSWNAYKKNDAWMAYIGTDDKVICTIPRVRVVEVEASVGVKGKKEQVKAWRVTLLTSSSLMYASPDTIQGFLKMECVEPEEFVRVAQSVERAVVSGGFKQIKAVDYSDIIKLATMCVDTSLYKEARDLSGLIMGLVQKNASMDDKIKAFTATPSVAFATACKFFQVQSATLTNLTTKSEVKAVSLKSMDDDDNVLMGRVTINVDYWNKLTDYDSIMVYKEAGNIAIKKKGKQQTTAQRFGTEKAGYLKAIHKAICDANTQVTTKKPEAIEKEDEALDDELFD
jgi:hypothetical protein